MSVQPCRPPAAYELVPETPSHGAAIERLLDRAFGPGRFAKSSERVREFAEYAPELSFCAVADGEVVGVVRMWRASVGGQPITFLGPLAVEANTRGSGLGAQLVGAACDAAREAGEAAVVLVGDLPFFGRLGFDVADAVTMPTPSDPKRVLARRFRSVALEGRIGPLA